MLQGYLIEWATNRPTLYNHCFCPETPLSNFRQNPLSVCNNAFAIYRFNMEKQTLTRNRRADTDRNTPTDTEANHNPLENSNPQPAPDSSQQDSNQDSSPICQTNADCVLVRADCCGCLGGGESIAVHKSQENNHNRKLREQCSSHIICPRGDRCDDFQAQCRNSQCITIRQRR